MVGGGLWDIIVASILIVCSFTTIAKTAFEFLVLWALAVILLFRK